jgi:hypothetical protein
VTHKTISKDLDRICTDGTNQKHSKTKTNLNGAGRPRGKRKNESISAQTAAKQIVDRMGKLLEQYEKAQGGDRGNQYTAKGKRRPLASRKQTATNAGLSEHERKTALRVAKMPSVIGGVV